MNRIAGLLSAAVLFAAALGACASPKTVRPAATPAAGGAAEQVNIFVDLYDLWKLNMQDGTYSADFAVMTVWKGDLAPEIEIMNGSEKKAEFQPDYPDTNGYHVRPARYEVEFRSDLNFANYPLDRQTLKLVLESKVLETDKMVFFTRPKQNKFYSPPHLIGWEVHEPDCRVETKTYDQETVAGVVEHFPYSRLVCNVVIERSQRLRLLFKLAIPLLISVLLVFVGFILPPEKTDTRFTIAVASVFGVLGSQLIYQQSLPPIASIVLIEWVHIIGLLTVLSVLCVYAWSARLAGQAKPRETIAAWERKGLKYAICVFAGCNLLLLVSRLLF